MAKQRINPEAAPERVFQPVAAPVDLYFRPNLDETGIAANAQILQALKDFSPQLALVTSDLSARNIAREENEAATAINEGTLEEAKAKATKIIEEGQGLIAPWRYTAALTEYGARQVREVYQYKIYEQLEQLAGVMKPDGKLMSGEDLRQAMNKIYEEVNIPKDSYYITQGAAAERAKIDAAILPKIQAKHAENVKTLNRNNLEDNLFATLNSTPADILSEEISSPTGRFAALVDNYYKTYGVSGSDEAVGAILKWAEGQQGVEQHQEVIDVINGMIDPETDDVILGGRSIGDRQSAVLKATLEQHYKLKDEAYVRGSQLSEQQGARLRRRVGAAYRIQIQQKVAALQEAGKTPTLNMSMNEVRVMAESLLRDAGADDDQVTENLGMVVDEIRAYQDHVNNPRPSNPQYFQDLKQAILMGDSQDSILDRIRQGTVSQALNPTDASQLELLASQYSQSEKIMPGFITNNPEMVRARAELQGSMFEDLTGEGENSLLMVPENPMMQTRVRRYLNERIQSEMLDEYRALTRGGIPSALAAEHIKAEMASKMEDIRLRVMESLVDPNNASVPAWLRSFVNPQYMQIPGAGSAVQRQQPAPGSTVQPSAGAKASVETIESLAKSADVPIDMGWLTQMFNPSEVTNITTMFSGLKEATDAHNSLIGRAGQGDADADSQLRSANIRIMGNAGTTLTALRNWELTLFERVPTVMGSRGQLPYKTVKEPALQFNPDGVYANKQGTFTKSDEVTSVYLKLKALEGFKPEELAQMKTSDGVEIRPQYFDWTTDRLFPDRFALANAVEEYEKSGGKTGVIANWMNMSAAAGMPITDDRTFIETQAELIKRLAIVR